MGGFKYFCGDFSNNPLINLVGSFVSWNQRRVKIDDEDHLHVVKLGQKESISSSGLTGGTERKE